MDNPSSQSSTSNFSKNYPFTPQNHPKRPLFIYLSCLPSSVFALFCTILCFYSFTIIYFNFNPLLCINGNIKQSLEEKPICNSIYSIPVMTLDSKKVDETRFSKRVGNFFHNSSCKVRIFMTWVSSIESFGERERFTIESLLKFNPNGCLLIVSQSMDSKKGAPIISPFTRLGFRVMAVSPDYKFIFKNTMGASWFDKLKKGKVDQGKIALGQNLSNLLRLCLLYKYGGIYMDTDFIVLKNLEKLRNSIGAQTIDTKTRNWNRLNNALMVFDRRHPLLNKFIDEFALTFNGNKWGHNGPYLVSRVVEGMGTSFEDVGNFTILPPVAFYPVGWGRIRTVFERPRGEVQVKQMKAKLKQIERESYALHLWNRESKGIMVENGSIISHLTQGYYCLLCNSSTIQVEPFLDT